MNWSFQEEKKKNDQLISVHETWNDKHRENKPRRNNSYRWKVLLKSGKKWNGKEDLWDNNRWDLEVQLQKSDQGPEMQDILRDHLLLFPTSFPDSESLRSSGNAIRMRDYSEMTWDKICQNWCPSWSSIGSNLQSMENKIPEKAVAFLLCLMCIYLKCMLSCFSHVWLFVALWIITCHTPLSMGFSRQECLSCSFLLQGDIPDLGIKPKSYVSCIGKWVLYHQGYLGSFMCL